MKGNDMSSTTINSDYLTSIAYSLQDIVDELTSLPLDMDNDFYPRGTIVKASVGQTRFKPKSVWVSLGDGTYKHLTGKKGLIATHSRLDGYVDVVFSA
jgi:hypothetical protein